MPRLPLMPRLPWRLAPGCTHQGRWYWPLSRASRVDPLPLHQSDATASIDGRDEHRVRLVGVEQPNLADRHVAEPNERRPSRHQKWFRSAALRQSCGSNSHTSPCGQNPRVCGLPTLIEAPGAGVRWHQTQRLIWRVPVVQRSSHAVKAGWAHPDVSPSRRLRMCGSQLWRRSFEACFGDLPVFDQRSRLHW